MLFINEFMAANDGGTTNNPNGWYPIANQIPGTSDDWIEILNRNKLIWSPVQTPLEVTRDEQAIANEYFCEWDHPEYGSLKLLNNPIKLSRTPAENVCKAPDLGEHTDQILERLGYEPELIEELRSSGII